MRRLPASALSLGLLAVLLAGVSHAAPPNLLIIHTDEHNFRTLGCYRATLSADQALMWGDAVVETPNIDWIATHGAICTSFYATTPVCSPSRSSFVSGRYPQNTPVVTNNIAMDDQIVTFATILQSQGYATGYAGKWHLDGGGKPQWAPQRKFGFADNRYMFNRGHWKQMEETPEGPRIKARKNDQPTYDVAGADEKSFTTDFLADKTVEFLREHAETSFCYMLSLPDPHGPDSVRPPYDTMYADQTYTQPKSALKSDEGLPSWGRKDSNGSFNQSKYYGMVKCIDDNVGKVLGALREQSLMENTIVVFTADHGDLRGEHHRHNKGVPMEGSAKIPFLIYYPQRIAAGTVVNQALGCVDFLPTILRLMEVPTKGQEQGRDASALFTTGKAPEGWTDVAFMRSTGSQTGWIAAISDRYKLVCSTADDPWLFDLQEDPNELINRFQDPACRETVRQLASQLAGYCQQYNEPRWANPNVKADLDWAVRGEGPYETTRAESPAAKAEGKKKRAKKKAGE